MKLVGKAEMNTRVNARVHQRVRSGKMKEWKMIADESTEITDGRGVDKNGCLGV